MKRRSIQPQLTLASSLLTWKKLVVYVFFNDLYAGNLKKKTLKQLTKICVCISVMRYITHFNLLVKSRVSGLGFGVLMIVLFCKVLGSQ